MGETWYDNRRTLSDGQALVSNSKQLGGNLLCSQQIHTGAMTDVTEMGDWFIAVVQGDGNFVLYYIEGSIRGHNASHPKWSSGTDGKGTQPYTVSMYKDGNLILTDSTNVELWRAPTRPATKQPCRMVMQEDGNLVIYDAADVPLWATNTDGQDHPNRRDKK